MQVEARLAASEADLDAAYWLAHLTDLRLFYHASMLLSVGALDLASLEFLPSTHAACAMIAVWGEPIAPLAETLCGVPRDRLLPLIEMYRHYDRRWCLEQTLVETVKMHGRYALRAAELERQGEPRRAQTASAAQRAAAPLGLRPVPSSTVAAGPPAVASVALSADEQTLDVPAPLPASKMADVADAEVLLSVQMHAPGVLDVVGRAIEARGADWRPGIPPLSRHVPPLCVQATIALAQLAVNPIVL